MTDIVSIRASSWWDLFDCAARWHYKHVDGLRTPVSFSGHLGISLHKATAKFDQRRIDQPHANDNDVTEAIETFVDALAKPEYDVAPDDDAPPKAEEIGRKLTATYCTKVSPRYQFAAVEMSVDGLDIVTEHLTIRMTGTADRLRVRNVGRGVAVSDLKSGVKAVRTDGTAETKGHKAQLGAYELLAEQKLGEPIVADAEIIGLQTTSKARIGTATVSGAKEMMVGSAGSPGMIEIAASMLRSGLLPPNPKSMLCSPKYCPGWSRCKWHE
jgi:hypothetical protein